MTSTTFWQKTAAAPTSCCNSNKNTTQLDVSELSAVSSATDSGCCTSSREEIIRERAYFLWEEAGRPEGDGVNFWIEAEKQFS